MRLVAMVVLSGICLGSTFSAPAMAQWFGKKAARNFQPATAPNQGLAGYIRRLTADARAAALRGDLAAARSLAARAHKISLTGKPMLLDDPDCSPQATAALVQQLNAVPDRPASFPSAAHTVAPNALDLNPLLDPNSQDAAMPIPPSPAPAVEMPPPKAIAGRREPAPPAFERSTSHDTARRKKTGKSSPSTQTAGFLALQTDWLSPDADADRLIEELTEQPPAPTKSPAENRSSLQAQRPQPPRRPARLAEPDASSEVGSFDEDDEDIPDLEVTTAIGRAGSRWQLDIEQDSSSAEEESAPRLAPDAGLEAERVEPNSTAAMLGVWSASGSNSGTEGPSRRAISLSDFLDPSGRRTGTISSADAPRMIETDFRPGAAAPLATVSPKTTGAVSAATGSAVNSSRPTVRIQDGPALEWLDSSPAAKPQPLTWAKSFPIEVDRTEWSSVRKAVVTGLALLVAGLALFGLSFRWI